MKTFIKILLLLIVTNNIHANCIDGITVYPQKETIYQNNLIVLTNWGAGNSMLIMSQLDRKHPVYLVTKDHEIKLNLKELVEYKKGYFHAILEPEHTLKPGRKYKLVIKNLSEDDQRRFLKKRNSKTGELDDIEWIVLYGNDEHTPIVQEYPKLIDESCGYYGCGPEIYAIFECKMTDESEIMILAEVKEIETNIITSFFTGLIEDDKIYIGRWMCGGPIDYNSIGSYEIRFKIYDLSGNTSDMWTMPIKYKRPCMIASK